jgi:hypothetical protein
VTLVTPPPRSRRYAGAALRGLLLVAVLAGSYACDLLAPSADKPGAAASARASTDGPKSAAPASAAEPLEKPLEKPLKSDRADRTHRAARCGECHEKMYDEWSGSAHAKADDSPAYAVMRKQAREPSCERCHAPLALLNEPAAFAAREAVSCEVCHRIEHVSVAEPMARMDLLPTHEVKFGPRCDPSEPYFHRARCSPLFRKAELCAACHQLFWPPAGGGTPLPVHTEYSDFQKTVYAARGKACQSCHMPGVRAELAIGERERNDVPDHGFLGDARKLRGSALTALGTASWQATFAELALNVTNARAGHAIPAGTPGRELVLRVSAHDQSGRELELQERTFARRLVDAEGRPAPFYAANRLGSDTRLQARETRREVFRFDRDDVRELRATLAFRALAPDLSAKLALPASELISIAETSIVFGAAKGGARQVVLKR